MYEILPHTADIKFRVTSKNLFGILRDSLKVINFYLKPKIIKTKRSKKLTFFLKIDYNSEILIDFLNKILFLIYTKKYVFELDKINKNKIILRGFPYKSLEREIKAITYHQNRLIKEKNKVIFEFIVDV